MLCVGGGQRQLPLPGILQQCSYSMTSSSLSVSGGGFPCSGLASYTTVSNVSSSQGGVSTVVTFGHGRSHPARVNV